MPLIPLEVIPLEKMHSLNFKRIGHISFDSNERTNFTARELKSVYVDFFVYLLKLQVNKCFTNKLNSFKQVGIISLRCVASKQQLAHQKLPPQMPAAEVPALPAAPQPESPPPAEPVHPETSKEQPVSHPPAVPARTVVQTEQKMETVMDMGTLQELRMLEREKARAVESEDFDEAIRLKGMILKLRAVSKQLGELEMKKRDAVKNEDYESAKKYKHEIERLKGSILAQEAPTKVRISRQGRYQSQSSHY